jgi:hypothetical protein
LANSNAASLIAGSHSFPSLSRFRVVAKMKDLMSPLRSPEERRQHFALRKIKILLKKQQNSSFFLLKCRNFGEDFIGLLASACHCRFGQL